MEHRTLKEEIKILKDVQEQMNNIDHKLGYESNYETLLKFYLAIKRLKTIQPKWIFRVARIPPLEENIFS
jgi:hypothetical protein